jgi:hypothetical protein
MQNTKDVYFYGKYVEQLYEKASFFINNNIVSLSFDDEKGGLTKEEAIDFIKKHYPDVNIEKITLTPLDINLM